MMPARDKFDLAIRPSDTEDLVKSSSRTTDLFEFLVQATGPVAISDISNHLKIPQSSASSLVKSLLDSGFLQKDSSSRYYQLSPRLPLLGLTYLENFPNIHDLRDQVVRIANAVDETTVLAMQNGLYSQYIYVKRKQPQNDGKHVTLGSLRPLACSASGWAMMTQLNDVEIGKYIRATNLAISDKHWEHNLALARTEIEMAKERGYAFSKSTEYSDTAGIAVCVPEMETCSYAICVAGREQNLLEKETMISEALRAFPSKKLS